MSNIVYCDTDDVDNVLSEDGRELRTDDSPPDAEDAIDDASSRVEQCCRSRYKPDVLAQSRIVKHWCKWIAAFLFCKRRGNDATGSIAEEYDRIMEEMKEVQRGRTKIGDIAERKASVPVMSNVRVSMEPWPNIRVKKSNSTGLPVEDYRQAKDQADFMDSILDYSI